MYIDNINRGGTAMSTPPPERTPATILKSEPLQEATLTVKRSWNGFDTFLRRGVMIGALILIWCTIALGVVAGSAVNSFMHNVNSVVNAPNVTTTDMPYDPSIDPGEGGGN